MFQSTVRLFITSVKSECRLLSLIHKFKKPILTADQQLIKEDDVYPKIEKHRSRRGISFFDNFEGKSIEGLDDRDERFGAAIIHARNLLTEGNDLMVLEGVNSIRDAVKMNAKMSVIYFTERNLLLEIPFTVLSKDSRIYYVKYRDMKKFSNMKTPPGIMAIFERPKPEDLLTDVILTKKLPLTLILDNIREPGNLGTIIRTAAGFNVNKVLLTSGCVDLYNEKVVRSTMSSLFCMPTFHNLSWDTIKNSLHPDCTVHYADTSNNSDHDNNEAVPYYHKDLIDFSDHKTYGLIVGGENSGISEGAKSLVQVTNGCRMVIPIVQKVNSLNSAIAAAILMSEFQKIFFGSK